MNNIINFQIENIGPINKINIDVGKINIIGGHNATGKSTASKLLYCFLKANSNKRQDFAYDALLRSINSILNRLNNDLIYSRKTKDMDILELLDEYEDSKAKYYESHAEKTNKFIDNDIQYIDDSIRDIQENNNSLYLSILENLLQIELSTKNFNGLISIKDASSSNLFDFSANFIDFDLEDDDAYNSKGSLDIYDVFYIDSFSIFDLDRIPPRFRIRNRSYYDHVDYLNLILKDSEDESKDMFDRNKNRDIRPVEKKVRDIINGKIEFNNGKFIYYPNDSAPCDMQSTASGIKQIGIIQLLLSNRKLKEDSFLIIDEPEVNLHPEWQFKLAEILTMLVKELNISIYLNTHSPMFIEAMEVFTEHYGLKDDTYYYLTKKTNADDFKDEEGNFKYIPPDELYELYDNLAKPYIYMERYRIRTKHLNDK